jgi:tetratricopeptide (TPR) repeat protein
LEGERLKPGKPINPLAYEYYLRGVDLYAKSDFPMSIKMLEKSAEIDPSYALTWAHLGRSYTADASFQFGGREQYHKAQTVYEKALSLEPVPIEAQIYMANFLTDTGKAEQAVPLLRQAIRTNQNYAEAHWELGYAYRFGGMLKESLAECLRARQLDPSVKLNSSALNAWLYLGEYDKFLESLPRNSDSAFITFYRGFGQYHKKNWQQAAADFDRAFTLDSSLLQAEAGKALGDAIRRRSRDGRLVLSEAENKIEQRGVSDPEAIYKIAQVSAALGDNVSALRLLGRSIEGGFYPYPYFASDPLLDNLRQDAEFVRLMTVARKRYEVFKSTLF